MRILVQGTGVAGLAVALELKRRGAEVWVIEKDPAPGGGASWLAGGMLAPFCERESADAQVIALGRQAAHWWEEALPGLVSFSGTLVVAPPRDKGEIGRFAARTEGFRHVEEEEIAALEPDLSGRFRKGLFFPDEAHLDPRQALPRLRESLEAQGVRFLFRRTHPPVGMTFDIEVDCTGAARIGTLPQLRAVRGEMLLLHTREVALTRPVRLIHPRIPVYVVPRGDGLYMVGATMIETDGAGPITARSVMELLNAAYALHPAFAEAEIVETGAGLRPAYPDNLPRVERDGRALSINGLYRHGFLLAPAMARQAADAIFEQGSTGELAHEAHH